MIYSRFFLKNQSSVKIPTGVFFLIIILITIFLSRFFYKNYYKKPTVSEKNKIVSVKIVNLSPRQVGVFWQTVKKETGWLIFGENEQSLDKVFFDERDTSDKKNSYFNHYVILRNLTPKKKYFFKVVNNNSVYSLTKNQPFSFITPENFSLTTRLKPVYGRVIDNKETPVVSAMVILSFNNCYSLASETKLNGEFLIPLNNIIEKTSHRPKILKADEVVKIEIFAENGQKTLIEGKLSNLTPLSKIVILGKNYSFLNESMVLSANTTVKNYNQIEILFPKEGSIIPSQNPLIKGLAIPKSEVIITINSLSLNISLRTKADNKGVWTAFLPQKLNPGLQQLTLSTKDEKGKEVKIKRNFSIAKSGEQVLGEATPEALPTQIIQTEALISPSPTVYLSPTIIFYTSTPTPFQSGVVNNLITTMALALIILGSGIILVF
ncbi:MAG: fibronectin type III domain-containing protein [Patescibacteria group bacterium]|nr:fibronectin type III domain-containing protein [Patescibacteria group bacterium]